MTAPRFLLTLEAMPGGGPVDCRLRMALKSLRRAHGLRCVRCTEIPGGSVTLTLTPEEATEVATALRLLAHWIECHNVITGPLIDGKEANMVTWFNKSEQARADLCRALADRIKTQTKGG